MEMEFVMILGNIICSNSNILYTVTENCVEILLSQLSQNGINMLCNQKFLSHKIEIFCSRLVFVCFETLKYLHSRLSLKSIEKWLTAHMFIQFWF